MKQTESRRFKGLLFGAAAGALMMFFLDPQRGRTRRALAQDKLRHVGRRTRSRSERLAENLRNRIYGKFQKIQHYRDSSRVSDETLEQRVRSAIGRKVSHVKPIRVFVRAGEVVLTGPILTHEVKALITAVELVPGVVRVIDELNRYDHPGNIPELQGEGPTYRR